MDLMSHVFRRTSTTPELFCSDYKNKNIFWPNGYLGGSAMKKWLLTATTAFVMAVSPMAFAGDLVINNLLSDPASVKALGEMVTKFEAENPDVKVKLSTIDSEAYKTAVRGWLTTKAPDVIFWSASERLRDFVRLGLIDDISDVWKDAELDKYMPATKVAVSTDGKQYAVPLIGLGWGFYHRTDLLEAAGIPFPKTFDELVASCGKLRAKGVIPMSIGTKDLWPAAAYFDYINFRLNGLDFHLSVLSGQTPFNDPKVKAVFTEWRKLIDAKCFPENHAAISFQDALPPVVKGEAAMYLMGSFIASNFPNDIRPKIGLAAFPTIDPAMPQYEDVTIDTIAIPAIATNKEDARKFLKFMVRADNQTTFNGAIGRLPVNVDSTVSDDPLTQAAFKLTKAAVGAGQYFDRDSNPEFAQAAMEGMQKFMVYPDQLDAILNDIAKVQAAIKARQ
jgi:multiple sugar transport system substrate-binding protein